MKRAPRSRQRHDLYAKYHDYDSEISDLLGECGFKLLSILEPTDREAVLAQSIQIMEPIGLPFFKRVPITVSDNALTYYLAAQDTGP